VGTLGELAVVAAALIVSVVIWTGFQSARKKRNDRDSGESGAHSGGEDHRDSAEDSSSDGGGD
jgi:hypothetical protein